MPEVPQAICAVCKRSFQRAYLPKHLASHSVDELKLYVKNREAVISGKEHPEFHCGNRIYYACPNSDVKGVEKDTPLYRKHATCTHKYGHWFATPTQPAPVVPAENIITMTVEGQVPAPPPVAKPAPKAQTPVQIISAVKHEQCECHAEIRQLKSALELMTAELTEFRKWREQVISIAASAPLPGQPVLASVALLPLPLPLPLPPSQAAANVIIEPKPLLATAHVPLPHTVAPPPVPAPAKKRVKAPPPASKKEQEKGMWCAKCESCKTTAQFTTDLKECGKCGKLCHYNSDLHSCYHWDCEMCKKRTCLECVKAAGGNKMHPVCSDACHKKYKDSRE